MGIKKLPEDIQKYIYKKIFFRILFFIVLETIAILFILFQHDRIFEIAGRADLIIAIIALLILPFFISGVPFKLIDSTWRGTVVDVKVKTTIDFAGRFSAGKNTGSMITRTPFTLRSGRITEKLQMLKPWSLVFKTVSRLYFLTE